MYSWSLTFCIVFCLIFFVVKTVLVSECKPQRKHTALNTKRGWCLAGKTLCFSEYVISSVLVLLNVFTSEMQNVASKVQICVATKLSQTIAHGLLESTGILLKLCTDHSVQLKFMLITYSTTLCLYSQMLLPIISACSLLTFKH